MTTALPRQLTEIEVAGHKMASRISFDNRHVHAPPLQTNELSDPTTAPRTGTPASRQYQTLPRLDGTPEETNSRRKQPDHQRFVLTDPVAFRYLEEDPTTAVLERRQELHGYECYVVEQWTTSRTHPTFVITTYTGDPSHVVVVDVLSVPTDEATWSPRLRVYFRALNHYHATRRQTSLGILMVTNLSSFPSSLTVIPVPDGDLMKHRSDFFVNENLKRLGCSGRVGLTLAPPSGATVAKFHQLYRTSDKMTVYKSVIELVKLCQSALMLFDKLEIDYADGLLCDMTERAINDWWIEIGNEQYNIEPHDGILGPTTVSGLLGLLMGSRNRLHSVNAPVSKDAFDVEAMKRGISHFQKQCRLPRTRRLDRKTLIRLQDATIKAANSEGWMVPKAVKSTVAELSGKGGEMVMDVVSRRDRAGIAEIETCDMDRFVQLIYGERCKWLWYGKPLKKARVSSGGTTQANGHGKRPLIFRPDDHGGFTWTARKSLVDGFSIDKHEEFDDMVSPVKEEDEDTDEEDPKRQSYFKRGTTGLRNETRSGIGKLKGAVGLKGHHHKSSAEYSPTTPTDESGKPKRPLFRRAQTSPLSSPDSLASPIRTHRLDAAVLGDLKGRNTTDPSQSNNPISPTTQQRLDTAIGEPRNRIATDPGQSKWTSYKVPFPNGPAPNEWENISTRNSPKVNEKQNEYQPGNRTSEQPSEAISASAAERSARSSVYNEWDTKKDAPSGMEENTRPLLRQAHSFNHFVGVRIEQPSEEGVPRHLSFSLAEESVLRWVDAFDSGDAAAYNEFGAQLAEQKHHAEEAKMLNIAITTLASSTVNWTRNQLRALQSLLEAADTDQTLLEASYLPKVEAVSAMQASSEEVLREQKERLEEGGKEIETLAAKLEYEIGGLKSRVEDVEAGVRDFEKGVARVEDRACELERLGRDERRWGCIIS
ncbi:protein stb2 [Acrodontium crateriforme]|uniref:Protein stb2 n=1 Tax=Acrodontium crateriforme TaxID=150365 RepID=A0AAQ3RCZ5_9PEZI|nr:protein stb2 [Acrodontium crateriforme]